MHITSHAHHEPCTSRTSHAHHEPCTSRAMHMASARMPSFAPSGRGGPCRCQRVQVQILLLPLRRRCESSAGAMQMPAHPRLLLLPSHS
eukprot:363309-Chlamydomonas_euryale.AAC.48